ncbi:hypothetical protein ATO6_16895 [Oceanicola sp. 22II-s10i]|uniref:hypothetical protein n=1 Tax=Oceanicola sp. 22II-s10i TaxID=1317116 RepID=UPI000B5264E2|nr:hypothetical protein [Oceanicola sp. 22II-s10i]OWU83558.1 hypothetical protein ATO6_16895 [Oceanicola sp. 22II-s10i]
MYLKSLALVLISATPALAGTQPADGHWRGSWDLVENAGCPQMMIDQIATMTEGDKSYERDIEFPKPFDPGALQDNDVSFAWQEVETDHWTGSYSETQTTAMGEMTVTVAQDLMILSEDAMDQTVVATIQMPEAIGNMLNMQNGTCSWTSAVEHRRDN